MESAEQIFKPKQMNDVVIRTFPDGVLSIFVSKPTEDDENPIPLTFSQETAEEIKKFIFGYDNSLLQETEKKAEELAKQLTKANSEISKLQIKLKLYENANEKVEKLQMLKHGVISGIEQLKPNTRVYICKNGVAHSKDVLVDVEDFREEIKNMVDNILGVD